MKQLLGMLAIVAVAMIAMMAMTPAELSACDDFSSAQVQSFGSCDVGASIARTQSFSCSPASVARVQRAVSASCDVSPDASVTRRRASSSQDQNDVPEVIDTVAMKGVPVKARRAKVEVIPLSRYKR